MEESNYSQLLNLAKLYLTQKLDYSRLTLAEKMSVLLSKIAFVLVAMIVGGFILHYLSSALVVMLAETLNSAIWAYVIVSGVFLFILLLVYAFRVKLIVNPITRCVTKLIVEPEDNDQKETV